MLMSQLQSSNALQLMNGDAIAIGIGMLTSRALRSI